MFQFHKWSIACTVASVAAMTSGLLPSNAAPQYIVTDLGTLGYNFTNAAAINASGQITGVSDTTNNLAQHAFVYSNGLMTDIGTLGGNYSAGWSLTDSGLITGYSTTSTGKDHAFLYKTGTMIDLGTLAGANGYSVGLGINASGQVAGNSGLTNPDSHAFLYSNKIMTDLGTLGGSKSHALGLNDSGQVIGDSLTTTGETHAFMYSNGTMTDLGTLGGTYGGACAINASGQVTGASSTVHNSVHAFIYNNGTMTDLGTLGGYSVGLGINASGQVVGDSLTASNEDHAFLYSNEAMADLNTRIDPNSGWTLNSATGINTNGQIVGNGTINGVNHGFLLTANVGQSPDAPLNVQGKSVSTSQITLTWSATPGASVYVIYRSTVSGTGRTIIGNTTGTSFSDTPLRSSTRYYYVVVAGNVNGWTKSPEASAVTQGIPGAPHVLATPISGSQINLTWTTADNATTYTIYRSTTAGTGYTIVGQAGSATNLSDTGLHAGTQYYYIVVAGNSFGFTKSPEASATTQGLPGVPNATATAVNASQINIRWTPDPTATVYVIYRSTVSGANQPVNRTIIGNTNGTAFADTSLQAGTRYYYVVVAGNANGWTKSPEVSAITPAH